MKSLLRNTLINALSLSVLTQTISGVKISGGVATYLLGGFALSLLFMLLRPVLNLIAFPLNALTLGFFSIFTNIIIFYLLTVLVTSITISAFTFPGYSFAGFVIPKIFFNTLFAFAITAFLQSFIVSCILWVAKK